PATAGAEPVYRRLAALLKSAWPDPARAGLAWWLVAIHVTLVLLVGGGISWSASRMLRDLADEQGKARVQLAATTAREDLRRIGEDARAAARALADRPTLQRLLAEGQHDALPPFLRRSCEADSLDACAVLSGRTVVAVSGTALVPLIGARATLADPSLAVYAVRRLDERLAQTLSGQVGAEVRLIDYRTYTGS